jgi:hypothetical protein
MIAERVFQWDRILEEQVCGCVSRVIVHVVHSLGRNHSHPTAGVRPQTHPQTWESPLQPAWESMTSSNSAGLAADRGFEQCVGDESSSFIP